MVLDRNLITFVFAPSKTTHGVSDIHLLTNPPTLEPSYHLIHSMHPDHYAIFLASPTDPPGEIIFGEVQVPGGLGGGKGEKAVILHQPEEIIPVGDKTSRMGFRFDWTFEWEGKNFKWSRDHITGIMKTMTLSYVPPREFKDDPPVSLALFNPSPSLTLLDYNFSRLPIKDVKGFEVITLLFASIFVDLLKNHQGEASLAAVEVKKETLRLQKLEEQEQERIRREESEEIARETERLRKLQFEEELAEKKHREEKVEKETARLRWQEGWYAEHQKPEKSGKSNNSPTHKKKHWWGSGMGIWNQREIDHGYQQHESKDGATETQLMGHNV